MSAIYHTHCHWCDMCYEKNENNAKKKSVLTNVDLRTDNRNLIYVNAAKWKVMPLSCAATIYGVVIQLKLISNKREIERAKKSRKYETELIHIFTIVIDDSDHKIPGTVTHCLDSNTYKINRIM